ncbi:hypothetical protein HY251_02915 [bacterium]|nr:hypothetical protein [bacterium]
MSEPAPPGEPPREPPREPPAEPPPSPTASDGAARAESAPAPWPGVPASPAPESSPREVAPMLASAPAPAPAAGEATPVEPIPGGSSARWVAALREQGRHPELAAFLGFLVPGLGHVYLGRTLKGAVAFVFLVGLYAAGILVSQGECVSLDKQNGHPYAFFAQVGAGLPTGLALLHSHSYEVKRALGMEAERPSEPNVESPDYVGRLPKLDEGLLYTMIAGLLNLLLIHDALMGSPGSALRREEEKRRASARSGTPSAATAAAGLAQGAA